MRIEVSPNALITIKVDISNLPIKRDFPCGFFKHSGIGCLQKTCLKKVTERLKMEIYKDTLGQILIQKEAGLNNY